LQINKPEDLAKFQNNSLEFPKDLRKELIRWTEKVLVLSFLMGMDHAETKIELEDIIPEPLSFEEAIDLFRMRVPMTKKEWNELEKRLRFRAFTVARLTELDAIEVVRKKVAKVLEEGKTLRQFWEEAGRDELLKRAGFHRGNPWYWETVFRTNIQTTYNAGRAYQFKKNPPAYLEFVGITDARQTQMCRARSGVIRRADDPFWATNWPPLHHNCYAEGTYVLTNEGWKEFRKITGEELFISINPESHQIEYVKAIRKIEYFYRGEMIHFKARNFDLLVTPEHNMAYISSWHFKKKNMALQLRPAYAIADSDVIPRTGLWEGDKPEWINIGDKKFPAKEFMSFMGWYLSEGSISNKSRRKSLYWTIKISQENEFKKEVIYDLAKFLFAQYFRVIKVAGGVMISGSDNDMWKYFKRLGRSYEKFIPLELKNLSSEYLRALLDSFNAGDGSYYELEEINRKKGDKWVANFKPLRIYHTSSKRLAYDIMELILKCGKLPSLYEKRGEGKKVKFSNGVYTIKHGVYTVLELNSKNHMVRKKDTRGGRQNIFRTEYRGMVYCVELEKNHMLYVMRNGKCTWSGNCRSTIRAVHREEAEAFGLKETTRLPEDSPAKGFGLNPIESGSFWKMTDRMIERAIKYGIMDEINRLAKSLKIEKIENSLSIPHDIDGIKQIGEDRLRNYISSKPKNSMRLKEDISKHNIDWWKEYGKQLTKKEMVELINKVVNEAEIYYFIYRKDSPQLAFYAHEIEFKNRILKRVCVTYDLTNDEYSSIFKIREKYLKNKPGLEKLW